MAQTEGKPPQKGAALSDPAHGYRIALPAFPKDKQKVAHTLFMYFAEPSQGFSDNVNVQIQPVSLTRDQFAENSRNQFKTMGWKLNAEKKLNVSGKEAWRVDYQGTFQGRKLRWLALAVVTKDKVYLVTGTVLQERFEKYKKALNDCLDSFKLKPSK